MGRRPTLDQEHEIPDDIEGGPYRPTEDDFIPSAPRPLGPLNKWPAAKAAAPAIFLWCLFWVFGILYWQKTADFAVSATRVFDQGLWWTSLTALFTHSGVGHLISNTPMFLVFGMLLSNYFGWKLFPAFCILLGIITNLITITLQDESIRIVGASGMVYAMVGMWLVYYFKFDTHYSWPIRLSRVLAFSLVVMYPSTYHPHVSYLSHAVGFVVGCIGAGMSLIFVVVREGSD